MTVKSSELNDPHLLPPDLPIPVDDGACNHLPGIEVPSIVLRSTAGRHVNVAEVSRATVFFFYPHTGKPGTPIPKGWNEIPGARGCTPQSCSFRDRYHEFRKMGFEVFGVSAQDFDDQLEFAEREHIPYELLNDSDFRLAKALRLPTFEYESRVFLKRLCLLVRQGRIERVFYPVFPPGKNADEVLGYLRR